MNHKQIMKRLAFSTLLLSAVASPVIANAADDTQAKKISTPAISVQKDGKTTAGIEMTVFSNPLELAKQYAPETVKDWKATLDKFEKLAASKSAKVTESMSATITDHSGPVSELKSEIVVNENGFEGPPAGAIQMEKVDLTEMKKDNGKSSDELQEKVGQVDSTTHIGGIDEPFLKAKIELNNAAKANDVSLIKQSLAKLLDQYKQQIKAFEAEK